MGEFTEAAERKREQTPFPRCRWISSIKTQWILDQGESKYCPLQMLNSFLDLRDERRPDYVNKH